MKTQAFAFSTLLALALASSATAQDRGQADVTFGDNRVAIDYGRPTLQGRDVETALPPGMLWRMGMNQATTIETTTALVFSGGVEVPAGEYSLYLRRVDETRYNLVVNDQTGQWGTLYDGSRDVVAIPLARSAIDEPIDRFTITLDRQAERSAVLKLAWGGLTLTTRFEVGNEKK